MTQSATQTEGVLDKKAKIDWESVERDYIANVLSIREIGRIHSVSDKAIRNKAKLGKWQRDLTDKVNQKVRNELVREEVRATTSADIRKDEKSIVEQAAATVVQVVREHRKDIGNGRTTVEMLMNQLVGVAGSRDEFEEMIFDETKDDEKTDRRAKLMKAVSLPVHAATIRDLSTAMKNLLSLERQAFNILGGEVEQPSNPTSKTTVQLAFDEVLRKARSIT